MLRARSPAEVTLTRIECTLIIQHDMRDIGKLPAFPAAAK
jgi:hypothetical protein